MTSGESHNEWYHNIIAQIFMSLRLDSQKTLKPKSYVYITINEIGNANKYQRKILIFDLPPKIT